MSNDKRMVNGSRYYRALESVSAVTILPMPDTSPSNADSLKLQLLTTRKKEWWPATAESLPQLPICQL